MFLSLTRSRLAIVATALALAFSGAAEAKVGGGASFGSRGFKTYSAPPVTRTAPSVAAPMQRSITGQSAAAASATMGRPSMFGGGLMRGLLFGGIMSALFGSFFGFGVLAHLLGFIVQTALLAFVAMLAWNWFTGRRFGMASMSGLGSGLGGGVGYGTNGLNGGAQTSYRSGPGMSSTTTALSIGPDDFSTFEKRLGEIQLAYGRGDTGALAELVTPEMLSYFAGDLEENKRHGRRNEISEPKLLQGDLSEAWHEASGEYATVAMRFSLLDRMVDATTGAVVSGSTSVPTQSTELWTFRRPNRGQTNQWTLSAIQQVN